MQKIILMIVSFLIAMLLEIWPVPDWLVWLRPQWVVLVLLFWLITSPVSSWISVAFFVGLSMDLLMNTLLGEHAFIYVALAYCVLHFHKQISLFTLWQQSLFVFVLVFLCQTFLSWISSLIGGFSANAWFWFPACSSALIWPFVYLLLNKYNERYTNKKEKVFF